METNSSHILLLFGVVLATLLLYHPNGEPISKLFTQVRSILENSDTPRSHIPTEHITVTTQIADFVKLDSNSIENTVENSTVTHDNTIMDGHVQTPSDYASVHVPELVASSSEPSPTNSETDLSETNTPVEPPKLYPFPLLINEQDFVVELSDVDAISVENSVRQFCLMNSEHLNISTASVDEGCLKPISRHILFETRELRAKLSGKTLPTEEVEILIPLSNYKGENEDFRITFNPATNSVEDIAYALCNQQKDWFGLSTADEINTVCVVPVSNLITSSFTANQSQERLVNSSGEASDSVPLEEGMIELGVPIKNYTGNEIVYVVTFNPSVSSPMDAAFALCNQNKEEFGLVADEFIEKNCVVPVAAYIVDKINGSSDTNNLQAQEPVESAEYVKPVEPVEPAELQVEPVEPVDPGELVVETEMTHTGPVDAASSTDSDLA